MNQPDHVTSVQLILSGSSKHPQKFESIWTLKNKSDKIWTNIVFISLDEDAGWAPKHLFLIIKRGRKKEKEERGLGYWAEVCDVSCDEFFLFSSYDQQDSQKFIE